MHHHTFSAVINHPTAASIPTVASLFLFCLVVSIASIFLCSVIAIYFYRSYRFFGFGYLLGLPTGFVILAASFVFEYLNLVYSLSYTKESLENLYFWIQLSLQSEGFVFIALSYMLKDRVDSITSTDGLQADATKIFFSPRNWNYSTLTTTRIREIIMSVLPMIVISIPLMVAISTLFVQPILNDTELKDMSIYTTVFDIMALGYIFIKSLSSVVKAANIKLLYMPAAFGLLWLEQYSLTITYFDGSSSAFIGSTIVRLAGLALFVYAIRYALSRTRISDMEIETGKET
ncbi:MAG: hypothetical protein WAM14_20175 [Candidatus Nitrosopolaris sp.]